MLTQAVLRGVHQCRNAIFRHFRRNIGISAVVYQKTAAQLDPIQQLFVDKVRDYAKKQQTAGGKLVEATADDQQFLQDNLEKLSRQYGATSADFLKFPSFSFTDPDLESAGVQFEAPKETASQEQAAEEQVDSREDKPYWET